MTMPLAIDSESHDEIQRQLAQCESDGEMMAAENARLRALVRDAFLAGYCAWAGPSNEADADRLVRDEQEAWDEWSESRHCAPF